MFVELRLGFLFRVAPMVHPAASSPAIDLRSRDPHGLDWQSRSILDVRAYAEFSMSAAAGGSAVFGMKPFDRFKALATLVWEIL